MSHQVGYRQGAGLVTWAYLAIGFLWTAVTASAQSITVSPTKGHPLGTVTISGTGYPASVQINIIFGTTTESSVTSSTTGAFSTVLQIPSLAQPGNHTISATVAPTGAPTTNSSPAVVNGVVYVGSGDNNVYALNASTGAVVWSFATGGAVNSSPAVANGVVYIGSDDSNVYALNATTGALLWTFAAGGSVDSSPAVANGSSTSVAITTKCTP